MIRNPPRKNERYGENDSKGRFLFVAAYTTVSTSDRTTLGCENGTDGGTDGGSNGGSNGGTDGALSSEELVTTRAKLSLVDLAGSEKGEGSAVGSAQERERSRINSSLSALSNCISCLGDARRTHVPFRDNPLTRWAPNEAAGMLLRELPLGRACELLGYESLAG